MLCLLELKQVHSGPTSLQFGHGTVFWTRLSLCAAGTQYIGWAIKSKPFLKLYISAYDEAKW